MPYGAIPLFAHPAGVQVSLPARWRYTYAGVGESEAHAKPDFDDGAWPETPVPAQHAASAGQEAIWYRVRFPRPAPDATRWLLCFRGAFQATAVWLNGLYLGEHYGYFSPFAFDLTADLAAENLLVVCCETRVESGSKKHPMGIWGDWDCRPYPNFARGKLPPEYVWTLPLGLWAPVELIGVGDVLVQRAQFTPVLEDGGAARVSLQAQLVNLTDRSVRGELRTGLAPHNFVGPESGPAAAPFALGPRGEATVTAELPVTDPQLWWPWTHGAQNLYAAWAEVGVAGQVVAFTRTRLGLRTVEYRGETEAAGPAWLINGRPIFPKGSNYISEFRLDTCTDARHRTDLQLMKDANMDMVRVHVHIEPETFYQAADDLGMLIICDSVLNGCYVHGAAPEDRVFHAWAARDQVTKTVDFLGNHPAVAAWLMHNEPPWPEHMWWFGEPHKARLNREVDLTVAALARELDPSRPVIVASGEKDSHLYPGWYHATWLEYRHESPRFITEFGAQALPAIDSPFWEQVKRDWPVRPDEPSWVHADFQGDLWARYGVGAPDEYPTLERYVAASQQYQAWIARYAAERFRIQKWQPCGGIVHFSFTDGHPAITWAVVDYYRRPKAAYYALRDAFRPTHVCIDPAGGFTGDRRGNVLYPSGGEVAFDLWLVNDDPAVNGPGTVSWRLEGTGVVDEAAVVIPTFDAPAVLVGTVRWATAAGYEGPVTLHTELRHGGRVLERYALTVLVRASDPDVEPAGDPAVAERARSGPAGA
ncbi:MAG TPA: glycoside hydrolase family 2 TIM barrel-domain containing protein [Symbiobacteriaceae bacterium]|jgi:beta-mannosidase